MKAFDGADRVVYGGTVAPGATALCVDPGTQYRCVYPGIDWGEFPYTRPGQATHTWQGTVLVDKPDATGTYYRRNRSYDPSTARFTQEDPLGLAGGLNVYGFASGDPVNFSDPFGLCPCSAEDFQTVVNGVAQRVAPLQHAVEGAGKAVGLKDLVDGVEALAAGKIAVGAFKIAMALPIGPGEEARAVKVAGRPFTGARAAEQAFEHLEKFHGVEPTVASNRLHKLKEAFGFGAKDNMIIGRTGDVHSPTTGERIGSLTDKDLGTKH